MINILYALIYPLLIVWVLWHLYIIVMGLYRAQLLGKLSRSSKVLGAPALAVGWTLDWLINWTIASVFFRELPRALGELVTQRLSRYKAGPPCINKHYAEVICLHLLDPFDPTGSHCK